MLRWSWCAKKPLWSPIFQRCLNVNGPKYAAGHLLAEVFSYITVRPVFVNTHQRDSARESGRRPLRWKDGCYIPSKSQLAPSLLNCGAALIFSASAAQIDLGALTSSNYSSRSSNAGTSQNARALKKLRSPQPLTHGRQPRTTCAASCAHNSDWHWANSTILCTQLRARHRRNTRRGSDGTPACCQICLVLQIQLSDEKTSCLTSSTLVPVCRVAGKRQTIRFLCASAEGKKKKKKAVP